MLNERKNSKIINKCFSEIKISLQDKDNSIIKLIKHEHPKAVGILTSVLHNLLFSSSLLNKKALKYIVSFINLVVKIIDK